jgi:hypothetical protein
MNIRLALIGGLFVVLFLAATIPAPWFPGLPRPPEPAPQSTTAPPVTVPSRPASDNAAIRDWRARQ